MSTLIVNKSRIYKYKLVNPVNVINLPIGAQILTAQIQNFDVCLWALVDIDSATISRTFCVYTTGVDIVDSDKLKYINTTQITGGLDNGLVLHVFEKL